MSGVVETEVKRGPGRPRKLPTEVLPTPEDKVAAAPTEVPDAPPTHAPVALVERAPVLRPCSLEDAPVGSKVVVSRNHENEKQVNLTTPTEVILLPKSDLAYTLPVGAKIRRKMPSVFEGILLNPSDLFLPLVAGTARDAVEQFRPHFKLTD
jgi:hypothetical protein